MQNRVLMFALSLSAVACGGSDSAPRAGGGTPTSTDTAATRNAMPMMTGDSLRGTIALAGMDSLPGVTISQGEALVVLSGPEVATLRRAAGLEVVVRGRLIANTDARGSAAFEVASFSVRALNGESAVDGVLDIQNGMFFVTTPEGRRVDVPTLPVPLRGEIGSRVYLAGSLNSGVSAFGVLAEAR